MAKKPNYNFERKERERQKAEKKAARIAKKKDAQEKKSGHSELYAENGDPNLTSPKYE